jgi:hypothetical protein
MSFYIYASNSKVFWVLASFHIHFPVGTHMGRQCIVSVLYTLFQESGSLHKSGYLMCWFSKPQGIQTTVRTSTIVPSHSKPRCLDKTRGVRSMWPCDRSSCEHCEVVLDVPLFFVRFIFISCMCAPQDVWTPEEGVGSSRTGVPGGISHMVWKLGTKLLCKSSHCS